MKSKFLTYEEAKKFAISKNIRTSEQWRLLVADSIDPVPVRPEDFYEEWTGWIDFLDKKAPTYEEAKIICKQLEIKSINQFKNSKKISKYNIPKSPDKYYKDDWKGWEDFLATVKKEYLSYSEAKQYLSQLNLSYYGWLMYSKYQRPKNIPRTPDKYYKDNGWVNWEDFLTYNLKKLDYKSAKEVLKKMKISSKEEYLQMKQKHKVSSLNFPNDPETFFKNDWTSWEDFLS